jgi:hypothetical protein
MAKASTISLKKLAPVVGKAVKAALDRQKLKAGDEFAINPGIIAGPLLDVATDLKVAQQIAAEVTAAVQKGAAATTAAAALPRLTPAVLVIRNRGIICGFFPYPVPDVLVDF